MKTKLLTLIASLAGILFPVSVHAQTIDLGLDWWWFKLGDATLVTDLDGLLVSNLDSSGQDGVGLRLKELSRTATLQFKPVNLSSNGTGVAFGLSGMVNDEPGRFLGKLSVSHTGPGTLESTLTLDPSPTPVATSFLLEVYSNDTLVGSAVVTAGSLGTISGDVRLASVTAGQPNPGIGPWILWVIDFAEPVQFSTANATGNRLRVVALDPVGPLQNLFQLVVTGRNLDSLLITDADAPQFQPRLRITRNGQNLRLNWDTRSAVLLHGPTVNGPWSPTLQGTNTVEFPLGPGPQSYFRLRVDPTAILWPPN